MLHHLLRPIVGSLLVAAAFLAFVPAASATPMPATGATSIYFSSLGLLTDRGLTVTPLGLDTGRAELLTPALLPSPTVLYGITEVDLTTLEIFHEGIGLEFTTGAPTVTLENFIINAAAGTVSADVTAVESGVMTNADVFTLTACAEFATFCVGADGTTTAAGLGLFLTDTAISVLVGEFGSAPFDGITTATNIGVANTTFTVIPEPSTALLMGLGLAGLAAGGTRRKAV